MLTARKSQSPRSGRPLESGQSEKVKAMDVDEIVVVVDYDPRWPEAWSARFQLAFEPLRRKRIQDHIQART